MAAIPYIPVSWGELIDKVTILEIRTERLRDAPARENAISELKQLRSVAGQRASEVQALMTQLKATNTQLWDVEDKLRIHERNRDFGPDFIALARAVYRKNDTRSALKRQINHHLGSVLVEEKSYEAY